MAIKCPKCGTENPEYVAYCGSCGEGLAKSYYEAPESARPTSVSSAPSRRSRWRYLIIAIGIVAILIFAALSAMLYSQTTDQRNSLYRAQAETVRDITRVIPFVNTTIHLMTSGISIYGIPNASWENGAWDIDAGARFAYGDASDGLLERLSSECKSISVMYDVGTESNRVFTNLSVRFEVFMDAVWEGMTRLKTSDQQLGTNYTSEMENASAAMVQIGRLLLGGFEPSVDVQKHPYDVLAGIDLPEIDYYSAIMSLAAYYATHAFDER